MTCNPSSRLKPTSALSPRLQVRALDQLKKAWHMGEYGARGGSLGAERAPGPPNITSARHSSYR